MTVSRAAGPVGGVASGFQLSALACWAYVALVAVIKPQYLPLRFEGVLPVRTDVVGIVAFGVSALLLVITGFLHLRPIRRRLRLGLAVIRSLALHAWCGWAYISANSISHRKTLSLRLTHLASWPTEGSFAVACFLVAVASSSVYCFLSATTGDPHLTWPCRSGQRQSPASER